MRSQRSIIKDLTRLTRQRVDTEYMLEINEVSETQLNEVHSGLTLMDKQIDLLLIELTEVVEHYDRTTKTK